MKICRWVMLASAAFPLFASAGTFPAGTTFGAGLAWQAPDATLRTPDVAASYCSGSSYGGMSGWRLPTELELSNLYYEKGAALVSGGWPTDWIYTSDTYASQNKVVRMTDGVWSYTNTAHPVTCVHTVTNTAADSSGRSTLTWQQPPATTMNWTDAGSYCAASGMRLPTAVELANVYYENGSAYLSEKGWPSGWIWTATPASGGHQVVRMTDGLPSSGTSGPYSVACVRDAQNLPANTMSSNGKVFLAPDATARDWSTADAFCSASTAGGITGWHLPTAVELADLYYNNGASAMATAGWPTSWIWTSTVYSGHKVVRMTDGVWSYANSGSYPVTCVNNAAAAPAPLVTSGGLAWSTPLAMQRPYTNTTGYCSAATIAGQQGWRLPTVTELQSLYGDKGSALTASGWPTDWIWTSSAYDSGNFKVVRLSDGTWSYAGWEDESRHYITCVKDSATVSASNAVASGALTFSKPASLARPWANTAGYCAAQINGQSGWRLPTKPELSALYADKGSAALTAAGWPSSWIWSSDPYSTGYSVVRMSDGTPSWSDTADASRQFAGCVRDAEGLPAGTVASGGLTWLRPAALPRPWTNNAGYCGTVTAGNHTDWRMPTAQEILDLYANVGSTALATAGWPTDYIWSSTTYSTGWKVVKTSNGAWSWAADADSSRFYSTCVR